jgi:hypothetical protein
MDRPKLDLDPLQRRALINAAIASVLVLVLGFGALALTNGDDSGASAEPTHSPSATPTTPACIPTWDVVQSADPGTEGATLSGIAVLSAGEAWAVGSVGADPLDPAGVVLERWDGNAWIAEEGPNPGSETNGLDDVDASEPNDVWAVGRTSSFAGERPLVVRYDGTSWTSVTLPSDVTGVLTGVEALTPNDVWVVGTTGDAATDANRALVLHWDGELWANVDLGKAAGNGPSSLNDITGVEGTNDLWAVGQLRDRPMALYSDGRRWERLESDVDGVMNAVEPVARDDVFAVGFPIQRYEGGAWSLSANVRSDGQLFSVAAVSPRDVWAVGLRPAKGEVTKTLIVRFDGQKWHPVEGAGIPGSDALTAVDALPDGTVLGVGYHDVETGRRTLAIRAADCLGEA